MVGAHWQGLSDFVQPFQWKDNVYDNSGFAEVLWWVHADGDGVGWRQGFKAREIQMCMTTLAPWRRCGGLATWAQLQRNNLESKDQSKPVPGPWFFCNPREVT